ncbi:hypothetical protein AMS58_02690 [Pseudoalteromonas porphyrae]|uniref:Uncharacterized protein n=2 Tax=Pseudoalteromonas TaxID=53246 RepID=A0A0N1EV50_9GAMM|nr:MULTISPECIES: hypothetical protein [Pseudoalteromonas]KPH63776.1 hypothetical protein ADS77_07605 [Pseudoalteromonas porphyrae]KPH96475.1 hypothetical protein AMS58_02690 [Pseudoalteromonas porphyrae]NMR25803.1 hypothetical protein [Pseudoalteromonas sp. NEC-BIFX-2020_015]NNG41882.1 hypothetical protein [Pseudoalteromonas sp. NEC-BIFX-2020_002]
MLNKALLICYRIIATVIILMPLILNVVMRGDVVASFIYVPLLALVLLLIAVYCDDKLVRFIT